MQNEIRITGARTHNLKNVSVSIPKQSLTVISGVSGSGKSTLAFDTVYAEGERRYVEGLSPFAKQFLDLAPRPDADSITGLTPSIAVNQRTARDSGRSSVGSVSGILDYLKLLFARAGVPHCPVHKVPLSVTPVSAMAETVIREFPEETPVIVLSPVSRRMETGFAALFQKLGREGFLRLRIDGEIRTLEEWETAPLEGSPHQVELVVDRLKIREGVRPRLAESLELAVKRSGGRTSVLNYRTGEEKHFTSVFACPECDFTVKSLEPRLFSPLSAEGACSACSGAGRCLEPDPEKIVNPELSISSGAIPGWGASHGIHFEKMKELAETVRFSLETAWKDLPEEAKRAVLYGFEGETFAFPGILPLIEREVKLGAKKKTLLPLLSEKACPACGGCGLSEAARNVLFEGMRFPELLQLPADSLIRFFESASPEGSRGVIAKPVTDGILRRLRFISDVGLGYLAPGRRADTLSGGESQRIRLSSELGSGLSGVTYVLDEPSCGLHQRDNARLIRTLERLRDEGNTVIVVEHDEETIRAADFVIDMGPGAGDAGGRVIASGTPEEIEANPESVTGQYLSGRIPQPKSRHRKGDGFIRIEGASGHNLRDLTVTFPAGTLCAVCGVSGSGKSSLITDTLAPEAARVLSGAKASGALPFRKITGLSNFTRVIRIDQEPLGRTPRSNPATATGMFQRIREIFSETSLARERGYGPERFSFNVKGGRCEVCEGEGVMRIGMQFLPDIYTPCDACRGTRYNSETLEVRFQGKNIAEVLALSVEEAAELFRNHPAVMRKLEALEAAGLGYLKLGQASHTLSGGEAQRVKIASELSRPDTGKTLYLLDEPTSGLHAKDVAELTEVLQRLVDRGHTVIVIEHNLDLIAAADFVLDMGPGGESGGKALASGTPEDVAMSRESLTGPYLKKKLGL